MTNHKSLNLMDLNTYYNNIRYLVELRFKNRIDNLDIGAISFDGEGNTSVDITGTCKVSQRKYTVPEVSVKGIIALRDELIQNALPELTNDQREFLISGIHPEVFDSLTEEE